MGFAALNPSYESNARPAMADTSVRQFRERREDARPGADALVIARQVVLLVRRMDVVVVEAEADQERVEPERFLEIGHNRDRGAGAEQHGLLAPFLRQRLAGRAQRLHVPGQRNRWRRRMVAKLHLAVAGEPRGDVIAEGLADLCGILARNEAERNLCGGFRRDHGLRALADIAADDAVYVAGRTRGNLLDQQPVLLAGRNRKSDRLQERLRRQVQLLPLREDVRRQILHAVIEAGDGDVAVLVEQAPEDVSQHTDW